MFLNSTRYRVLSTGLNFLFLSKGFREMGTEYRVLGIFFYNHSTQDSVPCTIWFQLQSYGWYKYKYQPR